MTRDRSRYLLALGLAVVAARLAGLIFGVLNVDEAEFCTIGTMIRHGALSYADIAEFKPPLTHLAFLPAGLFGDAPSIVPIAPRGASRVSDENGLRGGEEGLQRFNLPLSLLPRLAIIRGELEVQG